MAILGGSSTQRTDISEIVLGGLAGASSPMAMVLARDSTIGATLTALTTAQSDGPTDPATAALAAPTQPFCASTTKPQRSSSAGRMMMPFNAFGGLYRWSAEPFGEFGMLGNTASLGEVSLSAYTGGTAGLMASHIKYETK